MAQFAAQTSQSKTPNSLNTACAHTLPAQPGLSLAELISSGAYRMVVGIERLVSRH